MTVKGKDVIFNVVANSESLPIACARTASLTTTTDLGETSTLDTGTWKTFKGLRMSFTISCGGLVSFDMNHSLAMLREVQSTFASVDFEFFGSDASSKQEKYSGSFIITSISTPTSYNGSFEYSLEGQGTGPLTIEII
jgi:predicted secreted protein